MHCCHMHGMQASVFQHLKVKHINTSQHQLHDWYLYVIDPMFQLAGNALTCGKQMDVDHC